MGNWNEIMNEISATGSAHDVVRRGHLAKLFEYTGRNVIVYYSGWLQKSQLRVSGYQDFSVNDADKTGFMAAIHKLDRSKGLDLFLHTPGGDTAATESIVDYLIKMFGGDIRAIVPELAMSAGTMISLSCKEIIMGKHSSLGPIDPQLAGVAAHGVIEEFERAKREIAADQSTIPIWQPIIAKYSPTLIGECEKAIKWSEEITERWLLDCMFSESENAKDQASRVINELGDHAMTRAHNRHISVEKAKEIGLKVTALEDDDTLQELVLSVHHACIQTLSATPATKIIENHTGTAFISTVQQIMLPK